MFQSIWACCCRKEEDLPIINQEKDAHQCYQSIEDFSINTSENENKEPLRRETKSVICKVPSVIMAGESLRGTSIENISHNIDTIRNVSIQITNFSDVYTLSKPRVYTSSGYCLNPPQPTIAKKTSEACSFTKTRDTARGAVGVLTYEILNDEMKRVGELAIMFSVPYDYNWHTNYLGIGIYENDISCNNELFNEMYYKNGPFTAQEATGCEIKYVHSISGMRVKGTMSPAGKAIMKVEFRSSS